MKHLSTRYEPIWLVQFTKADVDALRYCSQRHYDGKCKAASEEGGVIYGISNSVEWSTGQYELRFRDADLLGKVLEVAQYATMEDEQRHIASTMYFGLLALMKQPGPELERIHG